MEKLFCCKECGEKVIEQTKFCPHCGKSLVMEDQTFTTNVEISFTKKPISCSGCRFGLADYDKKLVFSGTCLLNLDIVFDNRNKNKYYGFYGDHPEKCPIIISKKEYKLDDINAIIRKELCNGCRYYVSTNACQCNPYKECTEYDQSFFDSDYFKEKYLK